MTNRETLEIKKVDGWCLLVDGLVCLVEERETS